MKSPTKGFTLIETIAVIAIIAVVTAILTPVMMKVKENAKIAKSKSNMKQIVTAIHIYAPDTDFKSLPDVGTLAALKYITVDTYHTGGRGKETGYDVYVSMYPLPGSSTGQEEEWMRFVDSWSQNPVMFLDETWDSATDPRESTTKFGCFFDAHIEARKYPGHDDYENWNKQ